MNSFLANLEWTKKKKKRKKKNNKKKQDILEYLASKARKCHKSPEKNLICSVNKQK